MSNRQQVSKLLYMPLVFEGEAAEQERCLGRAAAQSAVVDLALLTTTAAGWSFAEIIK
jgi:hypothetical protein